MKELENNRFSVLTGVNTLFNALLNHPDFARVDFSHVKFCFGGGMVWTLLAAKEPRLAAAAPFYGPFPEGSSLKGSKAAVLTS